MATKTKTRPENRDGGAAKCPPHLVDELVSLNFARGTVEGWSGERARAVLEKIKRDTNAALGRADAAARVIDGARFPPPMPARLDAAGLIGAAMGQGDEWSLISAVENGVANLAPDELTRLAVHLMTRLRTPPPLPESAAPPAAAASPAPVQAGGREDDGDQTQTLEL